MVSSFSLSIIFCCESLSCNDGSKLAIESLTPCASDLREEFLYMCSMTSANLPFLNTSAIVVPKSDSKDHVMNLFRFSTHKNRLK